MNSIKYLAIYLVIAFSGLSFNNCETDFTTGKTPAESGLLKDGIATATVIAECDDCELRMYRITGMTVDAFRNEHIGFLYGPAATGYHTTVYNFNGVIKWFSSEDSGNDLPFHWLSTSNEPTLFDQFSIYYSRDLLRLQSAFPAASFHFQTRCPISVDADGEIEYSYGQHTIRLDDMVLANEYYLQATESIEIPCPEVEDENIYDPCILSDC